MKSIEKIKEEIGGKFLDFSELDKYMVSAGYHSNLPDVDLTTLGKGKQLSFIWEKRKKAW